MTLSMGSKVYRNIVSGDQHLHKVCKRSFQFTHLGRWGHLSTFVGRCVLSFLPFFFGTRRTLLAHHSKVMLLV